MLLLIPVLALCEHLPGMISGTVRSYATGDYAKGLTQGTGEAPEVTKWGRYVLARAIGPASAGGLHSYETPWASIP